MSQDIQIDGAAVISDLQALRMQLVARREYAAAGVVQAGCDVIRALLPPPAPPELPAIAPTPENNNL